MSIVRVLAVVDAVALPALGLYWITTWKNHGGVFGAVMALFLLWRGLKRAHRAVYSFSEYRWVARYFFALAIAGVVLQVVAWVLER